MDSRAYHAGIGYPHDHRISSQAAGLPAAAARRLAADAAAGKLAPEQIDEAALGAALDTCSFPDPDLVIRTSGEQRISNFLLWQCAYSEFLFVDELWPDFDRAALERALDAYGARDRRFGAVAL